MDIAMIESFAQLGEAPPEKFVWIRGLPWLLGPVVADGGWRRVTDVNMDE